MSASDTQLPLEHSGHLTVADKDANDFCRLMSQHHLTAKALFHRMVQAAIKDLPPDPEDFCHQRGFDRSGMKATPLPKRSDEVDDHVLDHGRARSRGHHR